jgi:hypothetical protein
MQLTIDRKAFETNSRLTAVRLAMLMSRCLENARSNVGDGDSAQILIAVVAISGERLTRAGLSSELRSLSTPLPPGMAGECNVSSIAAATGFNRETTRRKVNGLIDLGYLQRAADGEIALMPGILAREATQALAMHQLEAITRFVNEAMRDGVLTAD